MLVKTTVFLSIWFVFGETIPGKSEEVVSLLQKQATKLHSVGNFSDETQTEWAGYKKCREAPRGTHSSCKVLGGGARGFAKSARECALKAKKIGADTFNFIGKTRKGDLIGACWLRSCKGTDLKYATKPKKRKWEVFSTYCGLEKVAREIDGPCGKETTRYLKYVPPPTHACEAPLNFGSGMKGNNLNGMGPGKGAKSMRFREILPGIDLQVKTTDSYRPANTQKNGRYKLWGGSVNILSGTESHLAFSFVNASGRNKVRVSSFMFTVFDLDQSSKCMSRTTINASGYSDYYVTDDTELLIKTQLPIEGKPVSTQFQSTGQGNAKDNPKDPMDMTPAQAKRAVTFVYQNVKTFYMGFGLTAGENGRNIVFGGSSSITKDICAVAENEKKAQKAREKRLRREMRPKNPSAVPAEKVKRAGVGRR